MLVVVSWMMPRFVLRWSIMAYITAIQMCTSVSDTSQQMAEDLSLMRRF